MNIAFFLTPKSEVVTLTDDMTLRQAMEKMEFHRYSAVPVTDQSGHYKYTLSEGDILWFVKSKHELCLRDTETISINDVKQHRRIEPILIDEDLEDVLEMTRFQNFVPVVDDAGVFIGIVKRSDLILTELKSRSKDKKSKPRLVYQRA